MIELPGLFNVLYNYQYIFSDPIFLQSLSNTVTFAIYVVFIGTALKVLLGVFLNKNTPAHNFVQTIMFTPHIIASVAVDLGVKVSIMGADTRNVDGRAFGTMLISLPEDINQRRKVLDYLNSFEGVTAEEVR